MRGWRMTRTGEPADVLELVELPQPAPQPGQLLVEVELAGLSFADLLLIRGDYQITLPLPCVPGSEFVGRVVANGPGTTLPLGTRIIGLVVPPDGAFAEYALALEDQCEAISEDLPGPEAVSLIGNYVTAHLALHRRARLQPGETVVVHGGAGGVGAAAIQVAKAAGATVLAADLGPDRVDTCLAAGADAAVDVTDASALAPAVDDFTGGHGADVVLDMVGGELFEAARRFIAHEGRLVVVGFTSGVIPTLRVNQVLLRSFAVMGVNAYVVLQQYPKVHREARQAVIRLLAEGLITPPVGATNDLAELVEVSVALTEHRIAGKAVVQVRKT
jgi:NADPH2:quinone reductase